MLYTKENGNHIQIPRCKQRGIKLAIILLVAEFFIQFLILCAFQKNRHHAAHNGVDICSVFDADIIVLQTFLHRKADWLNIIKMTRNLKY